MALAFRFSARLGLCARPGCRTRRAPSAHGRPADADLGDIPGWAPASDALIEPMAQDKKVKRGALTFILARGIGQSFIAPDIAGPPMSRDFLDAELAVP